MTHYYVFCMCEKVLTEKCCFAITNITCCLACNTQIFLSTYTEPEEGQQFLI